MAKIGQPRWSTRRQRITCGPGTTNFFRGSERVTGKSAQSGQTPIHHIDPRFYPLRTSAPQPSASCNPGLVDVVHRVRGGPRVAPLPELAAAADWRGVPVTSRNGGLRPSQGFGFVIHFSQDHYLPLSYTPHRPAMARMDEKGFK